MLGRIVEVAGDRQKVSMDRGFLVVSDGTGEIGRVPIDDVAAVIGSGHGTVYTSNVLVALARRGAACVVCGDDHQVAGALLSVAGHWQQAKRMDAQVSAPSALKANLWKQLVRAKLAQQAAILDAWARPSAPVMRLRDRVRSGDPSNIEALAARRYWRLLFGTSFRRDVNAPGANALLNYGYAVLRSAVARSIVACGLHPTLGVHHTNEENALRLADDLMEPYRPFVDHQVRLLAEGRRQELSSETKRQLASVLTIDIACDDGRSPLMVCIHRCTTSLAELYLGNASELALPPVWRPAVANV